MGSVSSEALNLPMNRFSVAVLFFVLIPLRIEADTSSSSGLDYPPPDYASLRPSLALVVGILTVMFVLTFLLLAYAKFRHRPPITQNPAAIVAGTSDRFSGIDKAVIESLPFFRFSSLKGSKEGLECAVCLSGFEAVEVLRMLPKCRHAFHVDCIDRWLEKHSSCPLCRQRVSSEDLTALREDSNSVVELFVRREDSRGGSSRFSVGSSFRKVEHGGDDKDEESLIQKDFHKFKNRWSNVSSSDFVFLSSEMLDKESSGRFDSITETSVENNEEILKMKEEMNKVGTMSTGSIQNYGGRRSVSEITALSRCDPLREDMAEEGSVRRVWLPIARRTVQWFADRQERSRDSQSQQRQSLDV